VRRRLAAAVLLAAALPSPACGRRAAAPPRETVVAEVGGRKVTLADLDAYLGENLVGATADEPVAAEDLDRVKSRLLDGLLDEELLAAEAERRGIRATDGEIDAVVAESEAPADEAPPPPKDRDALRRGVLAQKLREADASEHATVSDEEVDAYLRSNAAEVRAKQRVRMQSLRFPDAEQAERVRRDIVARRLTFEQAAKRMHGERREESQIAVPLGGLPEPVRAAVAGLAPGQLSAPVRLDGGTFLFLVESGPEPEPGGDLELRDLARAELAEGRYREASKTLAARLRRGARIAVHPEALPFRYVPDDSRPAR
jgi:parvulin-like peptidyl-prolyl isomerase